MMPRQADGTVTVPYMLLAGAIAGAFAQTLMYPGDTVRRLMQTNGVNGNTRLYTSTWVGRVLSRALWLCVVVSVVVAVEVVVVVVIVKGAGRCDGAWTGFVRVVGEWMVLGLSGSGFCGCDGVLGREQDCCVQLYTRHGVAGFYRGVGVNLVRAIPGASIQFAGYELGKRLLGIGTSYGGGGGDGGGSGG